MGNERNKIKTTIYGREYTIVGTEAVEHLRKVARLVDEKMHEISAQNKSLDSGRLATLAAVNATHEYLLLEERFHQMEQELAKYKGRE